MSPSLEQRAGLPFAVLDNCADTDLSSELTNIVSTLQHYNIAICHMVVGRDT